MQTLDKALRNKLERTVRDARDIAEAAARASLEQLGVGEASPFAYLSEDQKELRRKLRAHGRQLGDQRSPETGAQEISRLVEEVAYEHWHRMLFARFLAENNLLMYPDPVDPVAVTLEECEDMATDEGAKNGWELAARYASRMLPQIFRPGSPVFQLILPPEHQQKLENLLADLPFEVFIASDSLGWVYQFWQAKKKKEINDAGVKIGAYELPIVTQLFTEPYMVSFLLDNSLGAWWAAHRVTEEDLKNAVSEAELRRKASLPGVPLEYLRFTKVEDSMWIPASGNFSSWPKSLKEFKALDPCCGSGHFLVAALLMLVPMRMEIEGFSARDAVDAVLRENLHGLEVDQRCVELAAFALALTAWRYPNAGGYRVLPELHVACSGLSINSKKEDWLALAGDNTNLQFALDTLYEQFIQAPILGSLITPEAGFSKGSLIEIEWEDITPLLTKALFNEQDDEKKEMGVVAQGLSKAATLMVEKYHWIITNVPYKKTAEMVTVVKDHFETHYPEGKTTLETAFLDRCLKYCTKGGNVSVVLPQNWLFLITYREFRENLIKNDTWHFIVRLGSRAFQTPMWEFNVQLLIISRGNSGYSMISGLDAAKPRQTAEKAELLKDGKVIRVEQTKQLYNPDFVIVFQKIQEKEMLSEYATINYGSKPGQTDRVVRFHWELSKHTDKWQFLESTPTRKSLFGGKEKICLSLDEIKIQGVREFGIRSADVWGKNGIIISQMNEMPFSLYLGYIFDNNTSVICPKTESHLAAIFSFVESGEYLEQIRKINQKLDVAAHTMVKVPFDLNYWIKIALEKYPCGLPKPYSSDPTQWLFHGHPAKSDEPLQVAVARLLGYRWPAELDAEMEFSDESRAWVKKCDDLLSYSDEDGIVCIPSVRGEAPASDQLLNLLAIAYSDSWSSNKLSELLKQADHAGKTLENWLREKFFLQHCKLFHHRPFIWHIWDGLRGGFAALVNYHKLDKKLLETLIYTYLGDWISRQKQDIANGVDGSQEKLDAAESLKKKLELILEGEAPYDIFVRWKPIEKQPIGWDPDINDGVRLNIRPFMSVPDVGKKGAGVLRDKPNINWNKDRGTDVESAPWYNLGLEYGGKKGDRINDHHLSLKQKIEARKEAK